MGVPPAVDSGRGLRSASFGTWLISAGIAVLLLAGVGAVLLTQHGGGDLPGQGAASGGSVPQVQAMPAAPAAAAPQPVYRAVTYELTGGMGALNVTYVVQGSAIEQVRSVGTPWSKSFVRLSAGQGADYLTVSAQNAGAGRLGCRIIVDGAVVSERSATGLNGVVMCAKSVT
jgi:hypothetical protein